LGASEYELAEQLNKIGKPVERGEWWMTVPTLDAYNNPRQNSITLPAAFLGVPLFHRPASDSTNFAGFGTLAGHEMTQGFDSIGRRYDASGSLKSWWTAEDTQQFETRSKCLVDPYSDYVVIDNLKVNGALTLSENIADTVGAMIAFRTLQERKKGDPFSSGGINRFTPEQEFFLAYAFRCCSNVTPETLRAIASSGDSHSPPKQRVNGAVSNMPEFQKAFGCKAGQPMAREKVCRFW
jgi:putative endopeptidase